MIRPKRNQMVEARDRNLKRLGVTYFQGHRMLRTPLVRILIKEHIKAVQDYDHGKADAIQRLLLVHSGDIQGESE